MRINTNIASMTAIESTTNTNKTLTGSLEKLSSGLRINKAADDASGMSIADKLRTQASSIGQGIMNGNSASALIQIADKAMSEQSNILDIVKQKLIQASTSTTSTEGRESIRKDISKLLEQFDAIAGQTNYNGTTLLQKSSLDTAKPDDFIFQLGESAAFNVTASPSSASNTKNLGGGAEVFGATSVNTSVTAAAVTIANSVGGVQYKDGLATDNNIGTTSAQQLNTSGAISLQSVDIAAAGTETAAAAAGGAINVTLSGALGKVLSTEILVFDASSETSDVKAQLKVIADNDTNVTWDDTAGTLTQTAASSIAFGDIAFSSLQVQDAANTLADLAINVGGSTEERTFTVKNNNGANKIAAGSIDTPLTGQLNVQVTSGAKLTGGELMSNLKELGAGELTAEKANSFMTTLDEAMTQLNANRADFGSTQNQLESSIRNMQTTQTNLKAAESVIRDVDYAAESANFNKQNIIAQAGTYAISQANNVQQNVMRLLQ